jgi:S-adenosylmethionine:tRNA ribosyltransferase-isomerase
VEVSPITLHVGLGTFRQVDVEDLTKHKMDSEQLIIPQETVDVVNNAKAVGNKICAIGTTCVRAAETPVSTEGMLKTFNGWTNKYIYPPYDFQVVNSLVTNFHTPYSTLLMMVSAFMGHDFMMEAYNEAVKEKYQFYSYGDAMLIL